MTVNIIVGIVNQLMFLIVKKKCLKEISRRKSNAQKSVNTFLVRSLVGDFGSMLCLFEFNRSSPFKMLRIKINRMDIRFVYSL